jgi:hypothetical protein
MATLYSDFDFIFYLARFPRESRNKMLRVTVLIEEENQKKKREREEKAFTATSLIQAASLFPGSEVQNDLRKKKIEGLDR